MSSVFSDERGDMVFNFHKPPFKVEQSFTSSNHKNVIRGMHFSPYKKFVTVVTGRILDVIVTPNGNVNTYELKTGDSILIDEHHGHGYFCFEDSTITYFLGGPYDPTKEKNCHWKDPTLNIKWPENSKYAIVSEKDKSNPLFKPIETLVLGSNGFLGQQLLKYVPNSVGSSTRLEHIEEELAFLKPKYVVSAAGISGKPTVDWCEKNKEETIHTNLTQQLNLIHICKKLGIHLTMIGSALVYDGEKLFTEEDIPDYHSLFYSHVRILLENIIREVYMKDVLYLRVIYPVSGDTHPKCFLNKIKSRKNNIHNTNVSLTIVPTLFPQIPTLTKKGVTGILNFTNDGSISLGRILEICNEEYTISEEKSNRGECKMDVSKLKSYIDVKHVEDILKVSGF